MPTISDPALGRLLDDAVARMTEAPFPCARDGHGLRRIAMALLVSVSAATELGCRGNDREYPPTYPVSGTVSAPRGTSLAGGSVEFHCAEYSDAKALGTIDAEGKYSLRTFFADGHQADGAVAGLHRVKIYAPSNVQPEPLPFDLGAKFTVEAQENEINLQTPLRK